MGKSEMKRSTSAHPTGGQNKFRRGMIKSMHGTRQAALQWHVRISTWMEDHGYAVVNSEKTIFMKHENGDRIMHGLFVDDMVHASTTEKLKQDFIAEYKGDFQITCNDLMTSFLGMEPEVEQDHNSIRLHLDTYIQDTALTRCRNIRQQSRNL
jgi:hypothetical protein